MVTLRDINSLLMTFVEFEFIYHIPGEYEGNELKITFHENNQVVTTLKIDWTNITLNHFIQLMKDFPGEKYKKHFTHFDKDFELQWLHEYGSDLYILYFEYKGLFLSPIKVNKENLHTFGDALENEMHSAPKL